MLLLLLNKMIVVVVATKAQFNRHVNDLYTFSKAATWARFVIMFLAVKIGQF